jgi:hypothetical protein
MLAAGSDDGHPAGAHCGGGPTLAGPPPAPVAEEEPADDELEYDLGA